MNQIKVIFTAVILFFCVTAVAQTPSAIFLKDSVKIINSSTRAVILIKGYFNEAISKELLNQLTKEQIALIEKYYNEEDYPECIKTMIAYSLTDEAANEKAAAIFASLKTYRFAKFDNIRNGENYGEQSILVVPASENKNVGGTCNYPTDFYIIIPTKDIKIL